MGETIHRKKKNQERKRTKKQRKGGPAMKLRSVRATSGLATTPAGGNGPVARSQHAFTDGGTRKLRFRKTIVSQPAPRMPYGCLCSASLSSSPHNRRPTDHR